MTIIREVDCALHAVYRCRMTEKQFHRRMLDVAARIVREGGSPHETDLTVDLLTEVLKRRPGRPRK